MLLLLGRNNTTNNGSFRVKGNYPNKGESDGKKDEDLKRTKVDEDVHRELPSFSKIGTQRRQALLIQVHPFTKTVDLSPFL